MDTTDWRTGASTLDEALEPILPGHRIFVGTAAATPRTLLAALQESTRAPAGAQLIHFLTDGVTARRGDTSWTSFDHRVFFVGNDLQGLDDPSRIDYVPIALTEVPALLRSGRLPVDVAVLQVSPPDDRGMCSLGVSVDIAPTVLEVADVIIAEINPAMPRTAGDTALPLDRLDRYIVVDEPIIEYVHPEVGEPAKKIAGYVARLIDDGSTLQIGLGRVPNEMLRHLTHRRDLGIHSDALTDGVADLFEAGAITGSNKTVDTGKVVASWCTGTRRLYDLVDGNDLFEFRRIEYVTDPSGLERQHALVSVTQAFSIDLTGQACVDSLDGRPYGGVSTQPAFHRGALRSPGGRAIVCLTSELPGGGSAIRPALRPTEAVGIARSEIHWVVTEYGTAYLFGRSLRERAIALIEIAHPRYRDELLDEAKALGLIPPNQTLRSRRGYPAEHETVIDLRDGREVLLRPAKTTDARGMQDLFFRLRPEDVYTRFFRNLRSLRRDMAEHLCSVGYDNEMAFVAVIGDAEDERIVGTGCYYLDPSDGLADVAYMIDPGWQGCGLGKTLQDRIVAYGRDKGFRGLKADVLAENKPMLAVLHRSGCKVDAKLDSGSYEVTMLFD